MQQFTNITKLDTHNTEKLSNQLSALYTVVGWNNSNIRTPQLCLRILNGSSFYMCVFHDEKLISFVRMAGDGVFGQIMDLITLPDYQNRGLASKSFQRVIEFALAENYLALSLIDGSGKSGFYNKFGFENGGPNDQVMYLEF